MTDRRNFLSQLTTGAASAALLQNQTATVVVDPQPRFEISPTLYMQFMEPLGTTDSSVEAAWDYDRDDWRKDFVDRLVDLAPGALRYGGLFSRHYKWREGVGPVKNRPMMRNYFWGGLETNRVGTAEFVDLSKRCGAEPFFCVNFLSDGEKRFASTKEGNRTAGAEEAAEWVSYANDPDNRERQAHGRKEPYGLKLWQIGNETSYGNATFTREESIAATIDFAKAMRRRDPSLKLIGWGDRGRGVKELWATELLQKTGDLLDMVAIHMMGQFPRRPDTVLKGLRWQRNPEQAWAELLELSNQVERRVTEVDQVVAATGSKAGIAITEGHLSLDPHNSNPILYEWLTAAYHARSLNIYQRHGARVKIATAADFQGNRWTVNCVMLQTPRGVSYLMPVGSVARLFKRHNGTHGVDVTAAPTSLDIAASRAGNKVFLHVANLEYARTVEASFAVAGRRVTGGRVISIAPPDLRTAVSQDQPNVFQPVEAALPANLQWRFPAGSVSVVELEVAE